MTRMAREQGKSPQRKNREPSVANFRPSTILVAAATRIVEAFLLPPVDRWSVRCRLDRSKRLLWRWGSNQLASVMGAVPSVQTTSYWEEASGALHLAHGVAFGLGELAIHLQHTSKNVITPEFVIEYADALARKHSAKAPEPVAEVP